MRGLIRGLFDREGFTYDFEYDWCLSPELRPKFDEKPPVQNIPSPVPAAKKEKKKKKCEIFWLIL